MVELEPVNPLLPGTVSATLTDPDGSVDDVAWSWERSLDQTAWTALEDADGATYTVGSQDLGHHLRATASYTDAEGSGKTASQVTAGKVTNEPQSVSPVTNLAVSPVEEEAGAVRLTWSRAEDAQVHFVVYLKTADAQAENYSDARIAPFAGQEGAVKGLEGGQDYSFIAIGMRWNWIQYGTLWGDWSEWVTATPGGASANGEETAAGMEPTMIGPVTNLAAVPVEGEPGAVRLTWTPTDNAQVHFVVYLKTADAVARNYGGAQIAPFAGSEGVVRGLELGERYSFIVIGMRWNWIQYGTLWGNWSEWVTATP